jgi:hypothetical protein
LVDDAGGERLGIEHSRWRGRNLLDGRRRSHRISWRRLSDSSSDRVRADALRTTDWRRLLIASATPSPAPRQRGHEKHEMPTLVVGGQLGSANFDAGCQRRLDQCRDDDEGRVQRSRRCELCERP